MGFNRLFRRLTRRGTVGAPPVATPLKYSDYLAGAAIVSGLIGASQFLQGTHPEVVGWAGLAGTIFVALSQWLQSKGD
ncbi:MAG: hypothetical protein L3K23_10690 [Thermoplasmata archaeon]|nr:hypothetical protein [Thermoplasmata archaeon]